MASGGGQRPQIPPGVSSLDNKGPAIIISYAVMAAVAGFVVVMRVVARLDHRGRLYPDDWLMIVSFIISLGIVASMPIATAAGYGQHVYFISPANLPPIFKVSYALINLIYWASTLGRVSFAYSLIMLVGTSARRTAILWFIIAQQLVFCIIATGFNLFSCKPISKGWSPQTQGTCLSWARRNNSILFVSSVIFGDIALLIMPGFVISKLQIRKALKYGLLVLLCLGVVNLGMAIATLGFVIQPKDRDYTWNTVDINIVGAAQTYCVIIICSIPFIRPLVTHNKFFKLSYYRSKLSSHKDTDQKTHGNGSSHSDTLVDRHGEKKPRKGFGGFLPKINESRFVSTTLRNAGPGMQTDTSMTATTMRDGDTQYEDEDRAFSRMTTVEEGREGTGVAK